MKKLLGFEGSHESTRGTSHGVPGLRPSQGARSGEKRQTFLITAPWRLCPPGRNDSPQPGGEGSALPSLPRGLGGTAGTAARGSVDARCRGQ